MPKFEPEVTYRDWAVILAARRWLAEEEAAGDEWPRPWEVHGRIVRAQEDLKETIRQAYSRGREYAEAEAPPVDRGATRGLGTR